jgi:hypothetical protein
MCRLLSWGVALASLLVAPAAYGWGPAAHQLVNSRAIETLPPPLRDFFQANRQFLIAHADDPDAQLKNVKEPRQKDKGLGGQEYIHLDDYGRFPYLKLPHSFEAAVRQYGKGHVNKDGLLPWHIGKVSLDLTEALRAGNWDQAKLLAAELGFYVADAHDPLHTTLNYDGQLTDQAGLAERFDTVLVDRFRNFFMFTPREAVKIQDPTEYAFEMVLESNAWVDNVLLADRRSLDDLPGHNEDYYDRFYSQVGSIVVRQLNDAAHDTGSYWYTAWLNAGQPELPH